MSDATTTGRSDGLRRGLVFGVLGLVLVGSVVGALIRDGSPPSSGDGAGRAADTAGAKTGKRPTTTGPTTTASTTTPSTTTTPTGRFRSAPGSGVVHGTGTLFTYSAEVEEGSGVDPGEFAAIVDGILADPRGWTAGGRVSFQRVERGGSITISLATPATTDQICLPLDTNGVFSCREGSRAVLNLRRWNEGTTDLPLSVADYRAEVVNHEVGHTLGKGHVGCGGPGLRAPVMMQQSKGLGGCLANPWPTLDGT
jgi:hypothetical protein